MSVHYKFKSNLNYDTVTFDGLHISVADLKKSILQQKKIGKSSDFDLQITNAQTKEVYDNDETLVPKNTSVIIARVPVAGGKQKHWEKPELPLPIDNDDSSGHIRFDKMVKSADLANSNVTEDDKVKAMINQSSQEYDPSKYVKSRSMTGPLPPTYVCYRCGKLGHWIKNCPTNNPDVKRSTGIPRSFMVPVDGPEHKGALLTSSGEFAVPLIDHQAYKEVKKEKPPFMPDTDVPPEPEAEIPDELLCMFCRSLLQDAVLIPCCGNSFCDECVRQALLDSDNHECPQCHETGISPDTVIPNRFLRTAVHNFKNETGYTRVKKLFPPPPQPQDMQHLDSPQPSPDSTVETQPPAVVETKVDVVKAEESADERSTEPEKPIPEIKKEPGDENIELTQPGTPLADEHDEGDKAASFCSEAPDKPHGGNDYHSRSYSRRPPDNYDHDSRESDENPISTIMTITNVRKMNFRGRMPPMMSRPNFPSHGSHHRHDHSGDYETRDRADYRGRYDRRNDDKPPLRSGMRHSRYDRSTPPPPQHHHREQRYHTDNNRRHDYQSYNKPSHDYKPDREYKTEQEHQHDYDTHPDMYQPLPTDSTLPPSDYQVDVIGSYSQPPVVMPSAPQQQPVVISHPQVSFPPQPPPPGASPIDTLSLVPPQPPPPGVGPLLPTPPGVAPLLSTPTIVEQESSTFALHPFKTEEQKTKTEESIDDRLEAFKRELEKRDRESNRDRSSSRSSRSRKRSRSRSSSRSSKSRSYNSSKSWTRSKSRSVSRSRSRSRSTYSSRRSRSFSRSRSRSRSKSRSFSRSPSRSRTKSRSRSPKRRRPSPRERERERLPTPVSRSHSPSPRNYHHRIRHSPHPPRRAFNPPAYTGTYAPQYPPIQSTYSIPPTYPPTHLQSIHPIQQPPVTHTVEHYLQERPRYQYNEMYPSYEGYQPKPYEQRYGRDQRSQRFESHESHRRVDEMHHRIPGWVGDRNRQEFKPRYRTSIDHQRRKEIKELPKVSEYQSAPVRTQKLEARMQKSDVRIQKSEARGQKSDVRVQKSEARVQKSETRGQKTEARSQKSEVRGLKSESRSKENKEDSSSKKKEEKLSTKHKKHHHHRTKERKNAEKQDAKPLAEASNIEGVELSNLIKVEVLPEKEVVKATSEEEKGKSVEKSKEKKHKKHKLGQGIAKKKTTKKDKLETDDGTGVTKVKGKKKKTKLKVGEEGKKEKKSNSKLLKEVAAADTSVTETMAKPIESGEKENVERMTETVKITKETVEIKNENVDTKEEPHSTFVEETRVETNQTVKNTVDIPPTIKEEQKSAAVVESRSAVAAADVNEQKEELIQGDELEEGEEIDEDDDTAVEQEDDTPMEDEEEDDVELHVEVPELSKWEREEFEEDVVAKPQRKSAVIIPKEEKASVSSEILQRAEKMLLHKPLKTAIVVTSNKEKAPYKTEKISIKRESSESSISARSVKISKEKDDGTAVSPEKSSTPSLQVTISTDKEKRSVQAKDEVKKDSSRGESHASKRVKLDRSNFTNLVAESKISRTVVVESSTDSRRRAKPESEKIKSRSVEVKKHEKISYNRRDEYSHPPIDHSRDLIYKDHPREKRHVVSDARRILEHGERRRNRNDSRDRQYSDYRESHRSDERRKVFHRRTPSGSPSESHITAKQSSRRVTEPHYEKHREESHERVRVVRKDSPKRDTDKKSSSKREVVREGTSKSYVRQISNDESKFEPDYDEFSDNDQKEVVVEKHKKRPSDGPDSVRKRSKRENVTSTKEKKLKAVTSSSESSSSPSESESSEAENIKVSKSEHKSKHKKAKHHKKHRKHKHKHKKKKSHKVKQRD